MDESFSRDQVVGVHPRADNMVTDSSSVDMVRPDLSPVNSSTSSIASSASESEQPSVRSTPRRTRGDRPRMADRMRSSSIIVPKNGEVVQQSRPQYPPEDARAMSPRRNSQDIEKLELGIRQTLKEQARSLQSSLAALAEKIDSVKLDHDKLESENKFLQDYIGGLTKTMAKDNNLGRSSSLSGKKRTKK